MPRRRGRNTVTDIRHQVVLGLEPELQQAIAQYHQTVRPGMPALLTFRELLWLGLGARPDVAVHRGIQRAALGEIRSFLMEQSAEFVAMLSAQLPQRIALLVEHPFTNEPTFDNGDMP